MTDVALGQLEMFLDSHPGRSVVGIRIHGEWQARVDGCVGYGSTLPEAIANVMHVVLAGRETGAS